MNEDAGETVQSEAEYAKLFDEAYRKGGPCPLCGGAIDKPMMQKTSLQPMQKISGN